MSRLRVGIVGVGGMGEASLRRYKEHRNVDVVAVCDVRAERVEEVARKYEVSQRFFGVEQLVETDLDLVSIHTRDHDHAAVTLAALAADKHVFVEKPMAHTIPACYQVIQAAERSGRQVAVGQVLRYWPYFKAIKEMVEAGILGELFYVEGHYLTNQMHVIPGLAARAGSSYADAILTLGVHPMDAMRWLAGDVAEVQAYGNRGLADGGSAQDACTLAIYKFASGCVGRLTTCWTANVAGDPLYGIGVYGSRGSVVRDQITLRGVQQPLPLPQAKEPAGQDALRTELHAVVDALLADRPVDCGAADAGMSAVACLAAVEALRSGAPYRIERPEAADQ